MRRGEGGKKFTGAIDSYADCFRRHICATHPTHEPFGELQRIRFLHGSTITCSTTHLTTFGGLISFPSSEEELLNELQQAVTFSTFTLDEAASLLLNFSLIDNPTIVRLVSLIISLDVLSLLCLGFYRGRRDRLRRQRQARMFKDEKLSFDLNELEVKAKRLAEHTRLTAMRNGAEASVSSACGLPLK